MKTPENAHPLARAIEQLYAAGLVPQIVLDGRRADVVVPDFIRERWGAALVINLDPRDPLDLEYDADGVHATLAFQGVVRRCTFAWPSIYEVRDRASGRGIVVPAHTPPETLPPELLWGGADSPLVTEIVEGKKTPPRTGTRDSKRPSLAAVPSEKPEPKVDATPVAPAPPAPAASSSDAEAKARRAKFRVIDGG